MSSKKRQFVERVQSGRKRQRDVAALDVARAEMHRRRRMSELRGAQELVEETHQDSVTRLGLATSVRDLLWCEFQTSAARARLLVSESALTDADCTLVQATKQLQHRARELLSVEKLLERLRLERKYALDKEEQQLSDELSARKIACSG